MILVIVDVSEGADNHVAVHWWDNFASTLPVGIPRHGRKFFKSTRWTVWGMFLPTVELDWKLTGTESLMPPNEIVELIDRKDFEEKVYVVFGQYGTVRFELSEAHARVPLAPTMVIVWIVFRRMPPFTRDVFSGPIVKATKV